MRKPCGAALITEKNPDALLKLPVVAPEEYDVRVQITRTAPGQSIGLILTRKEREFNWVGGAYINGMFAFGGFRGDRLYANSRGEAKKQAQPCFEEGRTYQVQVSVRNSGAAAYVDGQWVTRLPADLGEMRLTDDSPMRGLGQLGLSTYQASFRVHALQLREITGKAKFLRLPAAPAPKQPDPAMTQTPKPATPPPAPTDPVSIRLAELEKTYLAAYAAQVTPQHAAAVAALNANYTARLDRDIAAASRAGKLDEALALREEKTQIETHGTVPAEDNADLPAGLSPLRTTYRSTLATLLANRDQLAAPLHAAYDRALAVFQDELTRAQQLDEAARVKAVRDHAATRRESKAEPATVAGSPTELPPPVGQRSTLLPPPPVAPPLPADQVLPPLPKPSPEDITALVNWILKDRNGSVILAEGPSRREFKKGETLPRGTLKVVGIYIYEFPNDEPSRTFLDLLGGLPELESLTIKKQGGVVPIASLRGLTKLKSLTLELGKFDDTGFAHLSGLTELTKVHFGGISGFTGTGLGYLAEGLTSLKLSGCPHLTAEGLAYLYRFRKLNGLDIYDSKGFTDEALQPLAGLPELQTLLVSGTPLEGRFLAYLPDNSRLKTLELSETAKFQPQHLIELRKLKELETLHLPPLDPPSDVMASIATLGSLKEIHFYAPFTGETLADVKGFRSLASLDLAYCPVTDAGWAAIASAMPELIHVAFLRSADSTGPLSGTAMGEHLGRLKNLNDFWAGQSGITDEWMPAIAKLRNVRRLSLQVAGITDAGLVPLQDMEITHLILRQTGITDAAIPTLKRFPALRSGEFTQTKITDPVRAEFGEFLKGRAN